MTKIKKETAEIEEPREIIENLEKISQKLTENIREVEVPSKRLKKRRRHLKKTPKRKYFLSLVFELGFLMLLKNFSLTNLPIFTVELSRVLPAFYFLLAFGAAANLFLLLYDEPKIKKSIYLLIQLIALFCVYRLLSIFPFNFSLFPIKGLEIGISAGLLIVIVLLGTTTIIQLLSIILEE